MYPLSSLYGYISVISINYVIIVLVFVLLKPSGLADRDPGALSIVTSFLIAERFCFNGKNKLSVEVVV